MKKWYCYIITRDTERLHAGCTNEIIKCVAKYETLPSGTYPERKNCLVWLEGAKDEQSAKARVKEIIEMTKQAKILLVEKSNPDWTPFIIGVNITL